jgi:5-methylcytosine-specific restriction enzyme subunit McrC
MTDDRDLRRRMHALADGFGGVAPLPVLTGTAIADAERALNRLTAASASALRIIGLLHAMEGGDPGRAEPGERTPGFLFDMNAFFQRLLSRFLRENLSRATVVDEWKIRGMMAYRPGANPLRRQAPAPRPDFALREGGRVLTFLDAKYRDLWSRSLPADWLYQLAIYALASPDRTSVLLYAAMAGEAQDQVVDIRPPLAGAAVAATRVVVRPVGLLRLADLLGPSRSNEVRRARMAMADHLVARAAA